MNKVKQTLLTISITSSLILFLSCVTYVIIQLGPKVTTYKENFEPVPVVFSNNSEIKEIIKKRKVQVAFIDTGSLDFKDQKDFLEMKVNEVFPTKKSKDISYPHADGTIRSFSSELKNINAEISKDIEITYCHTSAIEVYQLESCLEYFDKTSIDFLNVSIGVNNLTEKEISLFKKLGNKGVIITVSSGNDSFLVRPYSLCALKIPNKICVGGINSNFKAEPRANYGSYVNAYESFASYFLKNGKMYVQFGTSVGSPMFLAKIVNSRFKEIPYDFETLYKNVSAANNWNYISSRTMASIPQ